MKKKTTTYNAKTQKVAITEEDLNWFDRLVMSYDDTVDNVKKAGLRKKALRAIADNALENVYQAIADEKAERKAQKEADKTAKAEAKAIEKEVKSKLEDVVAKATANA